VRGRRRRAGGRLRDDRGADADPRPGAGRAGLPEMLQLPRARAGRRQARGAGARRDRRSPHRRRGRVRLFAGAAGVRRPAPALDAGAPRPLRHRPRRAGAGHVDDVSRDRGCR
jgi:hypothetical protein